MGPCWLNWWARGPVTLSAVIFTFFMGTISTPVEFFVFIEAVVLVYFKYCIILCRKPSHLSLPTLLKCIRRKLGRIIVLNIFTFTHLNYCVLNYWMNCTHPRLHISQSVHFTDTNWVLSYYSRGEEVLYHWDKTRGVLANAEAGSHRGEIWHVPSGFVGS